MRLTEEQKRAWGVTQEQADADARAIRQALRLLRRVDRWERLRATRATFRRALLN